MLRLYSAWAFLEDTAKDLEELIAPDPERPKVNFEMGNWFVPLGDNVCAACLAGAVIFQEAYKKDSDELTHWLGQMWDEQPERDTALWPLEAMAIGMDQPSRLHNMLYSLDRLREYRFANTVNIWKDYFEYSEIDRRRATHILASNAFEPNPFNYNNGNFPGTVEYVQPMIDQLHRWSATLKEYRL